MDLAKELEIYYNMVYAEHICQTKLVNLLIVIKEKCLKILEFASNYDYDQNHLFNGYRSTVMFVVKFLAAVHYTKLNENFDGTVEEVILVLNALNKTLSSVLKFHDNSVKYYRDNKINEKNLKNEPIKQKDQTFELQIPIDRQSLVDAFEAMQDNNIPFIFNKYYEFFYKGINLNNINQTILSNFLENFDPWSWFKTLTSSTFTDTSFFLNTTQLNFIESTFGSSQLNVVKNWFPFLSSTRPYIVETITIKRQLEWLICPITFEIKHNQHKFQVLNYRKKFIKCKLLRNTSNSSGHLLIYIFSPDYFSNNKENEISNSFLNDWSLKLPGCSILVPELVYDKNEKFIFPLQLQDCLDVYLWAVGKNNCFNEIELLNMPKKFNNSNENLSLKRNHHKNTQHSRSSSIGGLSSYLYNNGLSSNSSNFSDSNSTSSNSFKNSEKVLDGVPDHLCLSGDSSGGNLATALLLVLNDLKIKFNFKDLKLPNALVLAYTPFNLRDYSPIMLTSRFSMLFSLSPIISLITNLPLPEIEDDLITLNNDETKERLNIKVDLLNKEINKSLDSKSEPKKQNEVLKQRHKKRSNSMNKYLVDRLNECKISDVFNQSFNYLNFNGKKDEYFIDDDLNNQAPDLNDIDDANYDSSSNDELNLSYLANALMSYLSQYYNSHISNSMNSNWEGSDEELKKNKMINSKMNSDNKLNENKLDPNSSQINPEIVTCQKTNTNLRANIKKMENFNNQENESFISQVQNALTIFRIPFFNGNGKKSTELKWNKEVVEKIFTEQREKAFFDLTSRAYISPTFYDDFESLENVSIYLLNSTCDLYLDDNVCFAKKWKGQVTLKVLDDKLPRGFLIERFLQDAKEGQLVFFKMVKEALELNKKLPKFLQN